MIHDHFERWPGETGAAYKERVQSEISTMLLRESYSSVGHPPDIMQERHARLSIQNAVRKGATDIYAEVERNRVRIIYWTPQTERTQA